MLYELRYSAHERLLIEFCDHHMRDWMKVAEGAERWQVHNMKHRQCDVKGCFRRAGFRERSEVYDLMPYRPK